MHVLGWSLFLFSCCFTQAHVIVDQLLSLFPDDAGKVKDMFALIDANEMINIRDISDIRIKNAIESLFQLVRGTLVC